MQDVKLGYRPDKGWCVIINGPAGETGQAVPVVDYIHRLHAFHKLDGKMLDFSALPVVTVPPKPKKAAKRKSRR